MKDVTAFKVICWLCFLTPLVASSGGSLFIVFPLFCCFSGAVLFLFLNKRLMSGLVWFGLSFVVGVVSGNLLRLLDIV